MTAALCAFLHHALAFLLVAVLTVELVLLKDELSVTRARSILRMDAAYGISAALLTAVGLLRVFYTEKGSAYYFASWPFIVKLASFALVGLLSIYPTMQFLKWRPMIASGAAPVLEEPRRRRIRTIIHIELTLLFVIMLCAALMARGIGMRS